MITTAIITAAAAIRITGSALKPPFSVPDAFSGTAVGTPSGVTADASVAASVAVSVAASVAVSVAASVAVSVAASVAASVGASVGAAEGASVGASVTRGVCVDAAFFWSQAPSSTTSSTLTTQPPRRSIRNAEIFVTSPTNSELPASLSSTNTEYSDSSDSTKNVIL